MAFTYTSKQGKTYTLCYRDSADGEKKYFLSKTIKGLPAEAVPEGYFVRDDNRGVLFLPPSVGKQAGDIPALAAFEFAAEGTVPVIIDGLSYTSRFGVAYYLCCKKTGASSPQYVFKLGKIQPDYTPIRVLPGGYTIFEERNGRPYLAVEGKANNRGHRLPGKLDMVPLVRGLDGAWTSIQQLPDEQNSESSVATMKIGQKEEAPGGQTTDEFAMPEQTALNTQPDARSSLAPLARDSSMVSQKGAKASSKRKVPRPRAPAIQDNYKVPCHKCGALVSSKELGEHLRTANCTRRKHAVFVSDADIYQTLRRFGHTSFKPYQDEAIRHLLDGNDVLAVLATGSGKSLIYQIAAHHRPGVTLVISPLIALMKDQVDKLQGRGIRAQFINSSLPVDEQHRRLDEVRRGAVMLCYIAPERLRQSAFQESLRGIDVGLLAVDEAHCISQWGHDFRPDYLHLAEFRRQIGEPPIVALTATATRRVQSDIITALALPMEPERVVGSFDRPNIRLEVERIEHGYRETRKKAKYSILARLLQGWQDGAAIIYVGTRRDANHVAWFIRNELELPARRYHAGMDPHERKEVQDEFISGRLPIVAATNAFGMGIDRADVRLIVHHTVPGSIEAYYQEVGRAGRDGRSATAVLLYHPNDRQLQDFFIENSAHTYDELKLLYDVLQQESRGHREFWTQLDTLSEACGFEKDSPKAQVGLQRLHEAGVIEQGEYEGLDRLIWLHDWNPIAVAQVLARSQRHEEGRRKRLEKMLAYANNRHRCRRAAILSYFDEEAKGQNFNCCDNCG